MKNVFLRKASAVILLFSLLFTSIAPVAYAEDLTAEESEAVIEQVEEELVEEVEEEPAEEVTDEETLAEEAILPEEIVEEVEETLPYGFPGMPEGYKLSEAGREQKQSLKNSEELTQIKGLKAGTDYVEDEIAFFITSAEEAEVIAAAYGATLVEVGNYVAVAKLNVATVEQALEVSQDINNEMPVVYANYYRSVDPDEKAVEDSYSQQEIGYPESATWLDYKDGDTFLKDPSSERYQWFHDMVNSYEAWTVTKGDSAVKVAVLDTGVDVTHPDLSEKAYVRSLDFTNYSYSDGYDADGKDYDGHGTNVAGIIAAKVGNSTGGAGIAPNVKIYSYCVLPGGTGKSAWICEGLLEAAYDGCKVINMSLGGYYYSDMEKSAISTAHSAPCRPAIIAAMGNDGTNIKCYPAGYDFVIAVGAVEKDGYRAYFSNYGAWCDIAAPGVNMLSTDTQYDEDFSFSIGGYKYIYMDGTSQATPVVSGIAALYLSEHPNASGDQVEKALKAATNKAKSSGLGAGIIDASKLFADEKAAPECVVYYDSDPQPKYPLTSTTMTVPADSILVIRAQSFASNDSSGYIVYTDNGSTPTVKNGEITNGKFLNDPFIDFTEYAGRTITIKAILVNAYGVVSKVATYKFNVQVRTDVTYIDVIGSRNVRPGKTITYKANVHVGGEDEADPYQKVTWEIVSGNAPTAKIDRNTGKLTTTAEDASCIIYIQATSVSNPAKKSREYQVSFYNRPLITAVNLEQTKITLGISAGGCGQARVIVSSVKNTSGMTITSFDDYYDFTYKSSNTSVVTVDNDGVITAVKPGTAKITVTAMDGSNKTATCSVTVMRLVDGVSIEGPTYAGSGTTNKYSAVINPSNATTKTVSWSIDSAPAGVTVSSSGQLKVPSSVKSGTVYLRATSKQVAGTLEPEYYVKTVYIEPKTTSIYLTVPNGYDNNVTSRDSKNHSSVKAMTLWTYDPGTNKYDTGVSLIDHVDGPTYYNLQWTSSNEKVAIVASNGYVHAVSAGKATITCKATDGSGKKVSVTVTVQNPASYIKITSNHERMCYADYVISPGKSATHKVAFGDTFGKPSVTKVKWSVYGVSSFDGNGNPVLYSIPTSFATISSSGSLSVKSAAKVLIGTYIAVKAETTDGTNVSDVICYYVAQAPSVVKAYSANIRAFLDIGFTYVYFYTDSAGTDFQITSSNPNVAGFAAGYSDSYKIVDSEWQNGKYVLYQIKIPVNNTGTATIKVKSLEGCNKSCSIKVTVVPE